MGNKIKYEQGNVIGNHGVVFYEDKTPPPIKGYIPIKVATFICPLCSSIFDAVLSSVKQNTTLSCGCWKKTHGLSLNRNYNIWKGIKNRCCNPADKAYNDYGGRGISISEEFLDVKKFVAYVESLSRKKDQTTIDRINNDGNYERGNIRWANYKEQALNKRPIKGKKYIYKRRGSYSVNITNNHKRYYIGNYVNYEDAIKARNNYIVKNNLPHALI